MSPANPGPLPPAANLVAQFLEYACPDHHIRGGHALLIARDTALRLLEKHPDLPRANLYTAIVCGELDEVRRILAEHPEAARAPFPAIPSSADRSGPGEHHHLFRDNGPKTWEPLLFLSFARLPLPAAVENSVELARLLLDHGANPNAYFKAGDSLYSPLVGVIGEGEENRRPHPRRDELADLLIARGANPFDLQVIYNIHFHGRVLWYLRLIHQHTLGTERQTAWDDPNWSMLDMGIYGSGARFLLNLAVQRNDLTLAEWILAHGASANTAPPTSPHFPRHTLLAEALLHGFTEMADLLVRYGAEKSGNPAASDPFLAACLRGDSATARTLARETPARLRDARSMTIAARLNRPDIATLLLDLGMSPNLEDHQRLRPLHHAAYYNSADVATLLARRGAEIDARDPNFHATPLAWAVYHSNDHVAEVLSPLSHDIWNLALLGHIPRVRQVLEERPELANALSPHRVTPLMQLPGHEPAARELAGLLLHHGADPSLTNSQGMTAADLARQRGLDHAAALIQAASRSAQQ